MDLFKKFFQSERTAGFILIACAIVSLIVANSIVGENFVDFFHSYIDVSFSFIDLKYTVEHWVNDGLMAVFFPFGGSRN